MLVDGMLLTRRMVRLECHGVGGRAITADSLQVGCGLPSKGVDELSGSEYLPLCCLSTTAGALCFSTGHSRGNECCFGEWDGEADTLWMHGDVLRSRLEQGYSLMRRRPKKANQCCAPVAVVGQHGGVDLRPDGAQVVDGEAASGLVVVGVAELLSRPAFTQSNVRSRGRSGKPISHVVMVDCGHKAGEAGDAMLLA